MGSAASKGRGEGEGSSTDTGQEPPSGSVGNAERINEDGNMSDNADVEPSHHSLSAGYSIARSPALAPTGFMSSLSPSTRPASHGHLSREDREAAERDEITLLRDNGIIPDEPSSRRRFFSISNHDRRLSAGENNYFTLPTDNGEPTETTALLQTPDENPSLSRKVSNVSKQWEEAVTEGRITTTWKREASVLLKNSAPLIVSCVLQYSLTGASVLAVGHLGKNELGAVSVAAMTSNITGYCVYEGLATSLDTLCAQAYGSGKPHLVGLHLQRMVYFLWMVTIPIAIIWMFGTQILIFAIPERESAELAGLFLKVLILGAPGFAAFEAGKRFVQAQGLFNANLYVLLFCAPLNAFLNWLFVWRFNWGFIGAPIAVAITHNLLPLCLFAYVYFVAGRECWAGFTRQALINWGPMMNLALPGLLMLITEFLAFEILTIVSSYISSTALASQSVLSTLSTVTFQIPFPVSIAGSTRLANLIGAGLADAGKICIKVNMTIAVFAGVLNMILLTGFREYIPKLFTDDEEVARLILDVIPLFVVFQLFDALTANCNGILRGLGRQSIGGWVNILCYYLIAMPISFSIALGLGWGLFGLWLGPAIGLTLVCMIEGAFIYHTNWERVIEAASQRNEAETV